MTILVVIVTYNAKDWLNTCIGELYNLDNIKIVVIDNNSTDETVAILKETYPLVHLIESNTNLGFGKANNLGFEFAIKNNFDYVFLLNQDASINKDSLLKLVANYNRYDDVGILSPVHYKNDIELENIFKSYLKNEDYQMIGEKKMLNINFVNAALWLISIDNLKLFGGFNPTFFHYGEDVEFVNRVKYYKKNIYVDLDSKGYHYRDYDIKDVRKKLSKKSHFGPWHNKYYIILLNNNNTILKSVMLSFRLFIISVIKHSLKRNWNSLKWDFKIFFEVIINYKTIYKNRIKNLRYQSFLNN